MLNLKNIVLTFPDGQSRVTAVDNVTMAAEAGQLTALIGPSGSGKSSLLAVASGLITPDSGTVTVGDAELTRMSRNQVTATRLATIGLVFQQPNLLPALTAVQNLEVMVHLQGRRASSGKDRAMDLLGRVGLAGQEHKLPHQLSGGQRQRVNIARALMNNPKVLLVDEPTSALDSERGEAIMELLTDLTHAENVATLLVTHNQDHLRFADAAWECVDGRVSPVRQALAA